MKLSVIPHIITFCCTLVYAAGSNSKDSTFTLSTTSKPTSTTTSSTTKFSETPGPDASDDAGRVSSLLALASYYSGILATNTEYQAYLSTISAQITTPGVIQTYLQTRASRIAGAGNAGNAGGPGYSTPVGVRPIAIPTDQVNPEEYYSYLTQYYPQLLLNQIIGRVDDSGGQVATAPPASNPTPRQSTNGGSNGAGAGIASAAESVLGSGSRSGSGPGSGSESGSGFSGSSASGSERSSSNDKTASDSSSGSLFSSFAPFSTNKGDPTSMKTSLMTVTNSPGYYMPTTAATAARTSMSISLGSGSVMTVVPCAFLGLSGLLVGMVLA